MWTSFASFEFVMDISGWGKNVGGWVGSRGWKCLGWNVVKWAEGTGLVYRMCFLF